MTSPDSLAAQESDSPAQELVRVTTDQMLDALDTRLPRVKAPTLIVQARHDQVIPSQTPQSLAERISGQGISSPGN